MRLLTNEDASRAAIEEAVRWLASEATDNDTVLFYFSGHGDADYLLPSDSQPDSYSADIATGLLDGWLDSCRSSAVMVVVDSCHSGGYAEGLYQSGRSVLASCSADEYAATELSDYIALGLSQPLEVDTDADHRISVEEIYDFLRHQTIPDQTPQLVDGCSGELELLSVVSQ